MIKILQECPVLFGILPLILAPVFPARAQQQKVQGRVILPNGWQLSPAGKMITLWDLPLNIAVSPDGKYAAVTNNGESEQSIQLIDIRRGSTKTAALQFL